MISGNYKAGKDPGGAFLPTPVSGWQLMAPFCLSSLLPQWQLAKFQLFLHRCFFGRPFKSCFSINAQVLSMPLTIFPWKLFLSQAVFA